MNSMKHKTHDDIYYFFRETREVHYAVYYIAHYNIVSVRPSYMADVFLSTDAPVLL